MFKSRRTKVLLPAHAQIAAGNGTAAVDAPALVRRKASGYLAIAVGNPEAMPRIVSPSRASHRVAAEMIESVTMKERMVHD